MVGFGLVGFGIGRVWFGLVLSRLIFAATWDRVHRAGKYLRLQANAVSSERSVTRLGWVGLGWDGILRCGDPGGGGANSPCMSGFSLVDGVRLGEREMGAICPRMYL